MVFLNYYIIANYFFNLQLFVLKDEYICVYAINGDETHKSKS
jgi:hypothetical protein